MRWVDIETQARRELNHESCALHSFACFRLLLLGERRFRALRYRLKCFTTFSGTIVNVLSRAHSVLIHSNLFGVHKISMFHVMKRSLLGIFFRRHKKDSNFRDKNRSDQHQLQTFSVCCQAYNFLPILPK